MFSAAFFHPGARRSRRALIPSQIGMIWRTLEFLLQLIEANGYLYINCSRS